MNDRPASEAPDELTARKAALRRDVLGRRASVHAERGEASAHQIAEIGLPVVLGLAGKVVSAYLPIRSEIDPLRLVERLIASGRAVALPVIEARERPLIFRAWRPGDPLEDKPFGLREPPASAQESLPDVLLVPMAAFDARGYRLGYGGGYYDRTLALLRATRSIVAIGLAFDEQEVEALPLGPHDQPLDMVLTPSGLRRTGG